jgi:hypothetical protein
VAGGGSVDEFPHYTTGIRTNPGISISSSSQPHLGLLKVASNLVGRTAEFQTPSAIRNAILESGTFIGNKKNRQRAAYKAAKVLAA